MRNKIIKNKLKGFTLIELLVVISIIGLIMALSIFGLQGARKSSRDARRKADIEQIRSGIEIYKSDCNIYPATLLGSTLVGDGSTPTCLDTNTYISDLPQDPLQPDAIYIYAGGDTTYSICAYLEQGSTTDTVDCGGQSSCGNHSCNYKVVNP